MINKKNELIINIMLTIFPYPSILKFCINVTKVTPLRNENKNNYLAKTKNYIYRKLIKSI
jgi:hypothetical protein